MKYRTLTLTVTLKLTLHDVIMDGDVFEVQSRGQRLQFMHNVPSI